MLHQDIQGKYFLSYEHIHLSVQALAARIAASGFDPDLIVAIGTGGFIPARILKTYMKKPILTVGISYYGRTYEEGKKIGWKDGFHAIWCILRYNIGR